jgi:hypothetical protein
MELITKSLVDKLYNKKETGIVIIPSKLENNFLNGLRSFIVEKESLFEIKREKYIKNNQLVSMLYRGPFELNEFKNTIFEKIIDNYIELRSQVNSYSEIPFSKGNSIEVKIIHYPLSELGVGIHKDLSSNINMIVFYNIDGETEVKTYSSKEGRDPINHPVMAGDISIMRGPRSKNEPDIRPYHGVERVDMTRTVLVIREINEDLEKITNKDNWRGF